MRNCTKSNEPPPVELLFELENEKRADKFQRIRVLLFVLSVMGLVATIYLGMST